MYRENREGEEKVEVIGVHRSTTLHYTIGDRLGHGKLYIKFV